MVIGKPWKDTLYFAFSCSYLKKSSVTSIFLLHKSNHEAKIKLSAKFKKVLWSGFRGTLNFHLSSKAMILAVMNAILAIA